MNKNNSVPGRRKAAIQRFLIFIKGKPLKTESRPEDSSPSKQPTARLPRDYAERGINEIRHILQNIRSYAPTRISLQNEIHKLGSAFSRATEVKIDFNYGNWPKTISENIDSLYLSFIQESLTNALKHGHATSISISCLINNNSYFMSVTDNGRGATLPIKKGIGITALEDVVSLYSGSVILKSDRAGFSIQVSIPRESLTASSGA